MTDNRSRRMAEICAQVPVIPVLIIEDADQAGPLAAALVAGGLTVLEVTLRTPDALRAIGNMVAAVPEAMVGAGTLRSPDDVRQAKAAGAVFGVSPGLSLSLLQAAADCDMPFLPGVATPSEAMAAAEEGLDHLKFFPAEANGGLPVLKAWASPLTGLKFCPTGGITAVNAPAYLASDNVACVGGSWIAPKDLVAAGDWTGITERAAAAAALR